MLPQNGLIFIVPYEVIDLIIADSDVVIIIPTNKNPPQIISCNIVTNWDDCFIATCDAANLAQHCEYQARIIHVCDL